MAWNKRRVLRLALLIAAILFAMDYFGRRPHDIAIAYHLDDAAQQLQHLQLRYFRGTDLIRAIDFDYRTTPAPKIQQHTIRVADGSYDILVELTYSDRGPAAAQEKDNPAPQRIVKLRRPLQVSGEGTVSVFIGREE